jgi:hypothetical protein
MNAVYEDLGREASLWARSKSILDLTNHRIIQFFVRIYLFEVLISKSK